MYGDNTNNSSFLLNYTHEEMTPGPGYTHTYYRVCVWGGGGQYLFVTHHLTCTNTLKSRCATFHYHSTNPWVTEKDYWHTTKNQTQWFYFADGRFMSSSYHRQTETDSPSTWVTGAGLLNLLEPIDRRTAPNTDTNTQSWRTSLSWYISPKTFFIFLLGIYPRWNRFR